MKLNKTVIYILVSSVVLLDWRVSAFEPRPWHGEKLFPLNPRYETPFPHRHLDKLFVNKYGNCLINGFKSFSLFGFKFFFVFFSYMILYIPKRNYIIQSQFISAYKSMCPFFQHIIYFFFFRKKVRLVITQVLLTLHSLYMYMYMSLRGRYLQLVNFQHIAPCESKVSRALSNRSIAPCMSHMTNLWGVRVSGMESERFKFCYIV